MAIKLMTGAELARMAEEEETKMEKRLKFCKDGVTIDGDYFIEENRINSHGKLFGWVYHLLGKLWIDRAFMRYFIERVSEHYKFKIPQD